MTAAAIWPLEIACDESGNDGENLFGGTTTVFAHGSTSISKGEAENLVAELYRRMRSQSTELKSKAFLKPQHIATARWLLTEPSVKAESLVHLTEKRFFLSTKLFDSTVEEHMHNQGDDIYETDQAVFAAMLLYALASRQLGTAWDAALESFNRLLRITEENEIAPHLTALRKQLRDLGRRCSGTLHDLIGMVHDSTRFLPALARQQAGLDGAEKLRTLDPVICAIGQTAHSWSERTGREILIVHDVAKVLTPTMIENTKYHLDRPELITPSLEGAGVIVTDVRQVDSRDDARVQLADLLAGTGRVVAQQALLGVEHPLLEAVRPIIDPMSVWGDIRAQALLSGDPSLLDAEKVVDLFDQ
ncbi:DUF3800 domain-containing protein [Microbacterium maritypicum]|uniref:DUF3800 domain-containing protein n=1 Tax=Microbacterium maritypicum TaxID=33918 RepID=UPI00380DB310